MIYWDHNATSPLRPLVRQKYIEALERFAGNADSIHRLGQEARTAIELTRRQWAETLSCESGELIFTGSATEANLMALWSLWTRRIEENVQQIKIIASPLEHPSITEGLKLLKEVFRAEVMEWPLNSNAQVDMDWLRQTLKKSSSQIAFCTLIAAHNETGLLQPWKEAAQVCHQYEVPFHSDAVQCMGRSFLDLRKSDVDLATLSFHKMGGPKGVALLYIRAGREFNPLIRGGGQEQKRRSGTENVPAIVATGPLLEEYRQLVQTLESPIKQIRDKFEKSLKEALPNVLIVGENLTRLPNTTYAIFADIKADAMLMGLDLENICASSGSACSSGLVLPSRALVNLGYTERQATSAIRFSLGPTNSLEEVPQVVNAVRTISNRMVEYGTRN